MNTRKYLKALLWLAALVIGVLVIYYAIIFEGQFPDHPALRGKNDLALHVAAFLALSVPLFLLGRWRRIVVGLVLVAGSIEIVHIFQSHRSADWGDFAGGVAGILLGALVALGLRKLKSLVAPGKEQLNE